MTTSLLMNDAAILQTSILQCYPNYDDLMQQVLQSIQNACPTNPTLYTQLKQSLAQSKQLIVSSNDNVMVEVLPGQLAA